MDRARDFWLERQPLPAALSRFRNNNLALLPYEVPTFPFETVPSLVAAIRSLNGALTAIQRTFLHPDTHKPLLWPLDALALAGKPIRQIIGHMGRGAVQLSTPQATMGLAGTPEDAVWAARRYSIPVWAVCVEPRMGSVELPPLDHLILFCTPDFCESGWAEDCADQQRETIDRVSIQQMEG